MTTCTLLATRDLNLDLCQIRCAWYWFAIRPPYDLCCSPRADASLAAGVYPARYDLTSADTNYTTVANEAAIADSTAELLDALIAKFPPNYALPATLLTAMPSEIQAPDPDGHRTAWHRAGRFQRRELAAYERRPVLLADVGWVQDAEARGAEAGYYWCA